MEKLVSVTGQTPAQNSAGRRDPVDLGLPSPPPPHLRNDSKPSRMQQVTGLFPQYSYPIFFVNRKYHGRISLMQA